MKLTPLHFSRLCASFRRWRRLLLLVPLVFSLLLPGVGLTAFALMAASLILYAMLVKASRLPVGNRPALPEDALCETVLVDASLIGQGTMLRAAAQPVDVSDVLSLRMGSGALLLGAAMTLTAESLSETDQAAVYRAVQGLNIVPSRLMSHQPVLARTNERGVTCIRVRDGLKERTYFMGDASNVAPLCASIWENEVRAMTEHDQLRLHDTARYIAQAKCRVMAYATATQDEAPIFLGFAGIGEEIDSQARQDIAALRDLGLTVMIDAKDEDETDIASLRKLLNLPHVHARPDIHLYSGDSANPKAFGVRRRRGDSLLEPIKQLRGGFHGVERAMTRFLLMLAAALLPCLTSGWTAIFVSAIMLGAVFFVGDRGACALPTRRTLALYAVMAVLSMVFLGAALGAALGTGLLTLMNALGAAARLCDVRTLAAVKEQRRPIMYVGIAAAAGLVMSVVMGVVSGVAVLPVVFAVLMGAAMGGVLLMLV